MNGLHHWTGSLSAGTDLLTTSAFEGYCTKCALRGCSFFFMLCLHLQVVCPVATSMAARQHVLLHFASSTDVYNMVPDNATRMQPPAGLCSGPNITWVARIGTMTYGEQRAARSCLYSPSWDGDWLLLADTCTAYVCVCRCKTAALLVTACPVSQLFNQSLPHRYT